MIAIQFGQLIIDLHGVTVLFHSQIVRFNFEPQIYRWKSLFGSDCVSVRACMFVYQNMCILVGETSFQGMKILEHFPNYIVKVYDSQI